MPTVRLTRKLAQRIDGIDLTTVDTGDQFELSPREAELLIAEGWAALVVEANDRPPSKKTRRSEIG